MTKRTVIFIMLIILTIATLASVPAEDADASPYLPCGIVVPEGRENAVGNLTDDNDATRFTLQDGQTMTVTWTGEASGVLLRWYDTYYRVTINLYAPTGEQISSTFYPTVDYRMFLPAEGANRMEIVCASGAVYLASLCEMRVCAAGYVPPLLTETKPVDLMLVLSGVSEETDLFGGLLPVYAAEHGIRTEVVYVGKDDDNRVPSKDAQVLQYCTDLVALDLGHNGITDLEWLRPLKKLQVLILADNAKLSDITPIGSLTKLKYIELFMTSVEDITPLSNLPNLLDANLCFTKITDVTPLKRCTKLERIWFGRQVAGQIGEAGIADLQSALPNAVIDTDVRSSTYNGWRDHPRYSAYIRMFRYNITVEPFVPED